MVNEKNYLEEAKKAIALSSQASSVYVGCDSQRKRKKKDGSWWATYAVVVILHIDSKHGCRVFGQTETLRDFGNLKQRLLTETMMAVNAALEIQDILGDRSLQVHLDINTEQQHKSSVAVKEALGYVRGTLGIEAKLKPEAFASSNCADWLCN